MIRYKGPSLGASVIWLFMFAVLQEYIFEDLRNRSDLAFAWLYQEYANCQGFCASNLRNERTSLASYDECLTRLLSGLLERTEQTTKEGFVMLF